MTVFIWLPPMVMRLCAAMGTAIAAAYFGKLVTAVSGLIHRPS